MADIKKVIEELEALYVAMHENQCYACSHEFIELANQFGTEIIADAIELSKEQDKKLKEYEKRLKTLSKIDKYFRIKDLEFLVDGIENGSIVVLQDDGHFVGGTAIWETTIKIRRL